MPRKDFRVKPYSDRRYKFVVRAKIDGKWRRRYFHNETEAQAYADQQNRRAANAASSTKEESSVGSSTMPAKQTLAGPQPPKSSPFAVPASTAPKIAHYLGGPWRMHLFFAYELMAELKPATFVELGVYKGESYFAFCQSVQDHNLATQCYGVDTWTGDLHSGLYCAEVGEEVASYNSRYARFSRLLAMTFNEAARQFQEGSIDLLHIDGAHRYEDVKKDFETWLPKLSRNGVILFHDVMERDRGFGVHRLWQEIARPRASFLFEFGHGLGVWRQTPVSKKDPPFLRMLFLADSLEQQTINRHYAGFSKEAELATKAGSDRSVGQTVPTLLHLFGSRNGAPCKEYSSTIEILPGQWCRPKIDLPWGLGDGSAPFRIDPVNRVGLVDLAAITLRSSTSGEILWSANTQNGFGELLIRGNALRLPHARLLRLLAYGDDPQVYLPHLRDEVFQDPLSLEIVLRFDAAPDSIDRAIAAWNESGIPSSAGLSPGEIKPSPRSASAKVVSAHTNTEGDDGNKIRMIIYSAGESGYSEDRASEIFYTGECWSRLDIALQRGLGTMPLRLDPLTAIGLIDVASMTLRSAINDDVLWRANGGGGLEALQVSGTAVRIPHPHLARILSYGEDPQIFLPAFPQGKFDGPLRLEVWLKTETGTDSIRKGISELAAISSRALVQESQSRGLLEQTTREASSKESEIQSLSAELQKALGERDAARAEVVQERQQQQRTIEERIGAQTRIENLESARLELESELTNLRESLHCSRTDTAQFITELEAERAYRANLEEQIKALEIRYRATEAEAESFKAALAASTTDSHEKLKSLKASLEAGAAKEVDLIRAQAVAAARELSVARDEIFRLQHHLLGQKTASTELRLKLDATKEKLRLQQSENEQFKASILWKATKPIRKMRRHFSKRRGHGVAVEPRLTSDPSYAFWLEHPDGPSVGGDKIIFSGWVIGPPQRLVYGVRAVVGGRVFVGEHGFERPDVGAAHEGRVGATHAGFAIVVDLPPGLHDVSLQALNNKGEWKEFLSHRHSVSEPPMAHAGVLELPRENTSNEADLLYVSGWIYHHEDDIDQLWANVKGAARNFLTYGLPRPDVAKIFPDVPAAGASGFEGYVPLEPGVSGSITVEVRACLRNGFEFLCFEREVTLQPLSLSPAGRDIPLLPVALDPYEAWLETNKLTPVLLKKMAEDAKRIVGAGPLISVIVPVYNTPEVYLNALIESLRSQIYPKWQLCLADDASSQEGVTAVIEEAARSDSRIKSVRRPSNGHIAEASNSALELADGDFIGLLDHDDLLTPDALLHVAEAICSEPGADFLYTDEDKLSDNTRRYDPIFKGAFSPEMSITHNYLQHFAVIRKTLIRKVGGFRPGFEGAQDLDLYLRVLEQTTPGQVRHLPFVCYHWRSHAESTASTGAQKTYVFDSAEKSISEALHRRRLRAVPFLPSIASKNNCCLYQLRWSQQILRENPVTILVPTKNRADLLEKCIASIERTVDPAFVQLLVMDDFSDEPATRRYLAELQSNSRLSCSVIQPRTRSAEFNFSKLINDGVAQVTTPLVLLLNNDTEALEAGWLEDMVGWMSVDGVGAVGAKLFYPDGTIQHAGVIVGSHGGLAEHVFHRLPKDVIGFNFLTHTARNVTAVTAACMLTSKSAFESVNGFDEQSFGMEYNDVDYCLRLGQLGKRIVFTPQAELLHHCGESRGVGYRPQEHLNFLKRYQGIKDPFYSENLTLDCMPPAINADHFVHANRIGPLKVMLISHNLNLEGAPKVLVDRAAYFVAAGYEALVLSAQDGPLRADLEKLGIPVIITEPPSPEKALYRKQLVSVADRVALSSFDLVICNTLVCFWGVDLARLFDLPVIWNIHESAPVDVFFPASPKTIDAVKHSFALADRVLFEAKSTRALFSMHEGGANFATISGSVDIDGIDRFCEQHDRDSLRRKHGLNPDSIVVSLIGTTCPRKGQHVFVKALEALKTEHSSDLENVQFRMVGGRRLPYLDYLEAQLQRADLPDTEIVPECENVYDFFRLSDVFVCASFQESFPQVVLLAMAFKLAIISTNVFGVAEMITDRGEGLLVAPGDASALASAILSLVRDHSRRKDLGARAHSKATRLFNKKIQLQKHLALTKEVVARHH
jgi:O-antigen biosynthesis protein